MGSHSLEQQQSRPRPVDGMTLADALGRLTPFGFLKTVGHSAPLDQDVRLFVCFCSACQAVYLTQGKKGVKTATFHSSLVLVNEHGYVLHEQIITMPSKWKGKGKMERIRRHLTVNGIDPEKWPLIAQNKFPNKKAAPKKKVGKK